MSTPTQQTPLAFDEPEGLSPRGTLVVLAGRGESVDVYRRLGARLAADSYRVRVLAEEDAGPARVAEVLSDAVAPHVLVGSDTGALRAAWLAQAGEAALDGLILAGLPLDPAGAAPVADWEQELELRTACPVHRGRLSEGIVRPGALGAEIPSALRQLSPPAGLAVPVLAVHGEADQISSVAQARAWLSGVVRREFVTVLGGRHDALNDATHRSVAAAIVLWLERLRGRAAWASARSPSRTNSR